MTELDDLETLFSAAATQAAAPSPALLARIVQDADRLQTAVPAVIRKGMLAALADWFGGVVPLAGMSVAALTGVYLGVVQPTPVLALANLVTGQTTIDNLEVLPTTATLWVQE